MGGCCCPHYLACLRYQVNISRMRELFWAGSGFVGMTSALPATHDVGVVLSYPPLWGGSETVINLPWLPSQ